MERRERYEDDLALVRGRGAWGALALFLGLLALLPYRVPGYVVYTAALVAAHAVIAVGLNLLVGYAGLISLGHAGFVAIGAYAAGLLMERLGVPWPAALVAGGIVAAAFGFLVGVPALRLTGPYLTIVTLGFGIAVHQVLTNWEALSGGRTGVFIPKLTVGTLTFADRHIYYLTVLVAALLTWAAFNLVRSHIGRAFVAIRDSDIAAEVMGVNLTTYKTLAFAVSAFYAGTGGALLAVLLGYLEPQLFTLFESIYYFSMIVVGGLGAIPGAILGAALLTILPQQLAALKAWLPVVYGTVIILVMAVEPLGLYGRWLRIKRWCQTWPF
jgi:branched-chain amino acid transport system permease protein